MFSMPPRVIKVTAIFEYAVCPFRMGREWGSGKVQLVAREVGGGVARFHFIVLTGVILGMHRGNDH